LRIPREIVLREGVNHGTGEEAGVTARSDGPVIPDRFFHAGVFCVPGFFLKRMSGIFFHRYVHCHGKEKGSFQMNTLKSVQPVFRHRKFQVGADFATINEIYLLSYSMRTYLVWD
jgi:hypothetical protein